MSKISQRVEFIANALIIVVAVALLAVIGQKYLFNRTVQPSPVQPSVGTKVKLPDADLSGHPKTLILALQKGCHFCSESAPFYKRLLEGARGGNVRLLAVLPGTPEESMAYLKELGLTNLEVKQSPLNAIQVGGTPTIILTNDKGEVTNFWVGKLEADKEEEVLSQLKS